MPPPPTSLSTAPHKTPSSPASKSKSIHKMGLSSQGFIDWLSRIYDSKTAALFDLLDNADDATSKRSTLKSSKWIQIAPKLTQKKTQINCLSIMNGTDPNTLLPISSLLSFALSSKRATSEIGENGVGLKQSVCHLCDSGLVLTRDDKRISIGLLSTKLNKSISDEESDGVIFPRIAFELESVNPSLDEIRRGLTKADEQLGEWRLKEWKEFCPGIVFEEFIYDSISSSIKNVKQRLQTPLEVETNTPPESNPEKYDSKKRYNFFRVILLRLDCYTVEKPDTNDDFEFGIEAVSKKSSSDDFDDWFIRDSMKTCDFIAEEYAQRYLNTLFSVHLYAPTSTYLTSGEFETVKPISWHRKMVFLCKHTILEDSEVFSHPFNIYIGYDFERCFTEGESHESLMLTYSRGRLVETDTNFRDTLNLAKSGDTGVYRQGLTVIVDDCNNQLTLNPTKEGMKKENKQRTELLQVISGVVRAYHNLIKRYTSPDKQRFVAELKEAVRKKTRAVEELTGDFKMDSLKLTNLTRHFGGNPKSYKIGAVEKAKGEHSVHFDIVKSKKSPLGWATIAERPHQLIIHPPAGSAAAATQDLVTAMAPAAEKVKNRSRAKKVDYNKTSTDTFSLKNGDFQQTAAKKKLANKKQKKTYPTISQYTKIRGWLLNATAQGQPDWLDPNHPPWMKKEFDYPKWKKEVEETRGDGPKFCDLLSQLVNGTDENFMCRRWLGSKSTLKEKLGCGCRSCEYTGVKWNDRLKIVKEEMSTTEAGFDAIKDLFEYYDFYQGDGCQICGDEGELDRTFVERMNALHDQRFWEDQGMAKDQEIARLKGALERRGLEDQGQGEKSLSEKDEEIERLTSINEGLSEKDEEIERLMKKNEALEGRMKKGSETFQKSKERAKVAEERAKIAERENKKLKRKIEEMRKEVEVEKEEGVLHDDHQTTQKTPAPAPASGFEEFLRKKKEQEEAEAYVEFLKEQAAEASAGIITTTTTSASSKRVASPEPNEGVKKAKFAAKVPVQATAKVAKSPSIDSDSDSDSDDDESETEI
ncbi:hypothetical protein TrLO_g9308 [Triparma laevis f. longispina]|uniref:Uncharacterized protein n=1 Tax=Triparma laevis f. longispina TaxID=1714387 RepID=A0A9W7FF51_9STRA|nr:hypothetical protein TrLO_g9308 [Triparma laevis f. longispina]